MMTYACPSCGKTIQTPEDQAGATLNCPECQQPIKVPKKDNSMLWVIGIVGGLLVGCVGLGVVVVVCLAAISVLGSNASAKFKSVADTIDTTPPMKQPQK